MAFKVFITQGKYLKFTPGLWCGTDSHAFQTTGRDASMVHEIQWVKTSIFTKRNRLE